MTEEQDLPGESYKYKEVSALVDQAVPFLDDWFTTERVWGFITGADQILTTESKRNVAKKLHYLVQTGRLDQQGKLYRRVQTDLQEMDWLHATSERFPLRWPRGRDGTHFGLDVVSLFHGNIVVVTGVSNQGKTTFALNLLYENMNHVNCVLFNSENQGGELHARLTRIAPLDHWVKPDGTPRFKTVKRYDNFEDVLQSGSLNIVDYLAQKGNFWEIHQTFERMDRRLAERGLVVVVTQKEEDKVTPRGHVMHRDLGEGGQFSSRLPRVYLSIDIGKLKVVKAKAWRKRNGDGTMNQDPNKRLYDFNIDQGARFYNIRPHVESV